MDNSQWKKIFQTPVNSDEFIEISCTDGLLYVQKLVLLEIASSLKEKIQVSNTNKCLKLEVAYEQSVVLNILKNMNYQRM